MLSRVARIFEQLNKAWDVLRTMTPSEYTLFRESLAQSSGFQSYQYRQIEFIVGNRHKRFLKVHQPRPQVVAELQQEMQRDSLYDVAVQLLNRNGLHIDDTVLQRERSARHQLNESVLQAWKKVYQQPQQYWSLYELAEKLVDFEDYFRRWRFNHVTTVERVIGMKRGTGGSDGVGYLKSMLEVVLFPELWQVRTEL